MTDLMNFSTQFIAWAHTPMATNTFGAALALLALIGVNTRICLALTIALHVVLLATR